MGIYDRDYYRNAPSRGGFAHFVAGSVTTWLMVINIGVFFADAMLHRADRPAESMTLEDDSTGVPAPRTVTSDMPPLTRLGFFSIDKAIWHGQAWRFITYQFLHANPWHLIVNMLGIYLFGPIVEAHFGSQRYLAFYLACGLAGALCFVVMALAGILQMHPSTPLVGASAGIFGLLVAAALIAPDVQIVYYVIPITIRLAAIAGMLFAAYAVIATGQNAGGEAAHLGGGVFGFVLMKNQHWLTPFATTPRRGATPRRRARAVAKDWSKDFNR